MSTFDPTDQPLDAALEDVTGELDRIGPAEPDQSLAEQGYYTAELTSLRAALLRRRDEPGPTTDPPMVARE